MSAIFKRPGEEAGIDIPLKEPVSKSMICMMFELDEKEFIYIVNEQGSREMSMLESEDTFVPTKPGDYFVHTGRKEDVHVNIRKKTGVTASLFKDQTDETMRKIITKMDYKAFGLFAQTCEEIQDMIEKIQLRVEIPLILRVSFEHGDPKYYMQTDYHYSVFRPFGRRLIIGKDSISILKQFTLKGITLDARNPNTTAEAIESMCSLLNTWGIHAHTLVVKGVDPTQTALLAPKLEVKNVVFQGIFDKDVLDSWKRRTDELYARLDLNSFSPEAFPKLNRLEINFPHILNNCHETDLLIRTLRSQKYLRFTHCLNETEVPVEIVRPLFKAYLKYNDHGLNKAFQMNFTDISNKSCNAESLIEQLLDGYEWNHSTATFPRENESTDSLAEVHHVTNGVTMEIMVYVTQICKSENLTVTFGHLSDDFGEIMGSLNTPY